MKPRQLPWKWLLLGLLVLLIAVAVMLPRHIGTSPELRDRVAAVLSAWTGATVTLTEPLSVRYFPPLSLRGGLVLTNATKLPAVSAITAPDVKISLDFAELLVGRIKIDALLLGKPTITLKEAPPMPGGGPVLEAVLADALTGVPIDAVRIRGGTIKTASGASLLNHLDVRLDAGRSGAMSAFGSFKFRDETVAFASENGALSEMEGGKSAPLTFKVTSKPVTASFSGTLRFAEGLQLDGDMQTNMDDTRHFLNWVGVALPEGGSLKTLSATGTAHWSGATLTFDDGTFSLDGNEADGLFAITAGERPRIEGTLDFDRLVLDPYLNASGTAPEGKLFDWALLKYIDADLRISAAEVAAAGMELGRGGFTIAARNGAISSEVGELELCGSEASGRVGLDLSETRAKASLVGSLSDVTVETCLQPLALTVPLKGTGSLKLDLSTGGTTREELIRGLVGEFRLSAENGAVPIDFLKLVAGTAPSGPGWSHDAVTQYKSLNADCRLSAGHIWCQSFSMETPQGTVSGSGGVNVVQQTLDWDLLIADPVTPLNASRLVMEAPPRVRVRGSLMQPEIHTGDRPISGDGSPQTNPESTAVSPR